MATVFISPTARARRSETASSRWISRGHAIVDGWPAPDFSRGGGADRAAALPLRRDDVARLDQAPSPERYTAIGHVMFCKDWVSLSPDRRVLATDPTDASTAFTNALAARTTRRYWRLFGLRGGRERPSVDPPKRGRDRRRHRPKRRHVPGVAAGTPVSGGLHYVTASAVGLGSLGPGALSVTAGTFSINEALSSIGCGRPALGARAGLKPGQWMNMSISPASSNNVDWFLHQAYRAEMAEADRRGVPVGP